MKILSIKDNDSNKIRNLKKSKCRTKVTMPVFKAGPIDAFVKEKPILYTIESIARHLENNKNRLGNGKIFNEPVANGEDTLLMLFLHIKPLQKEMSLYKGILFDMSQMPEINYNQEDLSGISSLEWIMLREEPLILSLIKDKHLPQDTVSENVYEGIKNPEFKLELIKLDIYKPKSYNTVDEQKALVSSILNSKSTDIDDSLVLSVMESLRRNDESSVSIAEASMLRRIVQSCSPAELKDLPDFINCAKDTTGQIDINKLAYMIAIKEMDNSSLRDIVRESEEKIEIMNYMDTAKAYLEQVGIEYVQDKQDGLLILGNFDIDEKYKDIPIDFNKLFKCIKAIVGPANFCSDLLESLTDFGNLQYLCSDADFCWCEPQTTGKIESIGIDVDLNCPKQFKNKYLQDRKLCFTFFSNTKFKSTGKIKYIGGDVSFEDTEIVEMPELEIITGFVHLKRYSSKLNKQNFASIQVGGGIIED